MKHNDIEIIPIKPLSDEALAKVRSDMMKIFGVPHDRRLEYTVKDGGLGRRRISHGDSRLIQLATFMSYAVHNGNLTDARTLADAYDKELDNVLGRTEIKGDIWRG